MARDRLSVGDVVGPYHLLAERAWGQGIYRAAIDTRTYENVSLCEVLPKPDTDEARKARQLTELRHPSLISLRAIEQYDDVMFAVLDGVDGAAAPFSEAMPESVRDRIVMFVEAYSGIAALAEQGVVGLPLGIEAIVLTDAGRAFALPYDALLPLDWKEGATSQVEARAPETIERGQMDARSDVFSAASVLFTLLTEKLPFAGATSEDRMGAKLRGDARSLASEPYVPRALVDIVATALDHTPTVRWANLDDFLDRVLMATTGAQRSRIAAKHIETSGTFPIPTASKRQEWATVMDFKPPEHFEDPPASPAPPRRAAKTIMGIPGTDVAREARRQSERPPAASPKPAVATFSPPVESRITDPGPPPEMPGAVVEVVETINPRDPRVAEAPVVVDVAVSSPDPAEPVSAPAFAAAPAFPSAAPAAAPQSPAAPLDSDAEEDAPEEEVGRLSLTDEKVETYYWLLWPVMVAAFGLLAYVFLSS